MKIKDHLRRLDNGKWQVVINRRLGRAKKTFEHESDAKAWRNKMLVRIDGTEDIGVDRTAIGKCFQDWREHISEYRSPQYGLRVDVTWASLGKWLESKKILRIRQLTPAVMLQYWSHRRKSGGRRSTGCSDQTILNDCRALCACLNWCCEQRSINRNPIRDFSPPTDKITHVVAKVPSPDVLQQIFYALPDDDSRRAFWGMCALGCRVSAFCALQAKHIRPGPVGSTGGRWLDVVEAVKGDRGYSRPLPDFPFPLPSEGHLFTNGGKPWTEDALLKRIVKACDAAGVDRINCHSCRHVFGTYQLARGEGVGIIMSLAGWSSVSMVERYRDGSQYYAGLIDPARPLGYLPVWR